MTIENIGKTNCSGCSLCSMVCPKQSITMESDREGFLFPLINHSTCIDCGLCYKKCPCNGEKVLEERTPIYYTSAIKDKKELLNSSSGGNFIAFAKYILSKGGFICGCIYNQEMKAVHTCTNDIEVVHRMMGSKYVQSDIRCCFDEVKELTEKGKTVLFTGTACQVAAIKTYIKKQDNLILVDILCHGVPSPLFFKKYIDFLERKHNGNVVNVEFRNKKELGWGSEHRTYYEIEREGKKKGYIPNLPAYFCSFFWGLNLRESCYNCKFAGRNRISDITIGDFWGYWTYFHKNFPEGISIASVNTEKGKALYKDVKDDMEFCIELPEDKAKGTNTNFYHPTPRPVSRDFFYDGIESKRYESFRKRTYLDKSCRKKLLKSIYGRFVPEWIKSILRKGKLGV